MTQYFGHGEEQKDKMKYLTKRMEEKGKNGQKHATEDFH